MPTETVSGSLSKLFLYCLAERCEPLITSLVADFVYKIRASNESPLLSLRERISYLVTVCRLALVLPLLGFSEERLELIGNDALKV